MLPLRDALLSMNDAVAIMDDVNLGAELGGDIADATSALASFSSCIFASALMRNLCSEDIARVNSASYSRLSSRAASPHGGSASHANAATLVVGPLVTALKTALLPVERIPSVSPNAALLQWQCGCQDWHCLCVDA